MKLSKVVLRGLVANPGASAHSFEGTVDSFTSQQYELSLVDNVVNVLHVESGESIIVPLSEVRYAKEYLPEFVEVPGVRVVKARAK